MSSIVRHLTLIAACGFLASCQNGLKSNDPYVSNYGNDGAYNPYPNQPGTMQSGHTQTTPTYTTPPAPPPQTDPYAFSGPSTTPSKPSSSSSTHATKPKSSTKSTASTGSKSKGSGSTKSTKSTAKSGTKKSSSGSSGYKVQQGDTLYGIARKKGSSVSKIKAANHLSSDIIRPGMTLKVP